MSLLSSNLLPVTVLVTMPSLVFDITASLVLKLSEKGMFTTALVVFFPKLPLSILNSPSSSEDGLAVTKFMTPFAAFLPKRVPCGPFRTSTLSRSKKPVSATTLSLTLCPLTAVTTEAITPAPIPKEPIPLIVQPEPEPMALEVSRPGVISARSETS